MVNLGAEREGQQLTQQPLLLIEYEGKWREIGEFLGSLKHAEGNIVSLTPSTSL